ncbi:invasion associated locus B family protein [uncultured Nitrosomonas sp.]|uniref:invasion associated locus B family protein n=1 Tax=uncultured Nitrosomonas sp. TaxID=156424 RepID=UPI0026149185|nr:invasion associated locus B family protein [uncultured Nitrosomonas sp.]
MPTTMEFDAMKRIFAKALMLSAVSLMAGNVAQAADPKAIGEFGDWIAYVYTEGGNKVCYMAGKPQKEEGNYTKRGAVYALITHRPADKSKNVFSFVAGYPYKQNSEVTVSIGSQRFKLFTESETAWAPDSATDNKLIAAIRSGSQMVVNGTSSQGTATIDTFGLKGSTAAYTAISKECGIK